MQTVTRHRKLRENNNKLFFLQIVGPWRWHSPSFNGQDNAIQLQHRGRLRRTGYGHWYIQQLAWNRQQHDNGTNAWFWVWLANFTCVCWVPWWPIIHPVPPRNWNRRVPSIETYWLQIWIISNLKESANGIVCAKNDWEKVFYVIVWSHCFSSKFLFTSNTCIDFYH